MNTPIYQVAAAYPACEDAVWFVEGIVCCKNDDGSRARDHEVGWDLIEEELETLSVDDVVSLMATATDGINDDSVLVERLLLQMRTPEFAQYIAGKLGLM